MVDEAALKTAIGRLLSQFRGLPEAESEAEKRAEDFIRPLFEAMGWDWLSKEVKSQKRVRSSCA